MNQETIYQSPYYLQSLNISRYIYENMKSTSSTRLWCHFNHHLVTCIKLMYPELKNYVEIGTHYGHSFCSILNSGHYKDSKFIAIDPDKNMLNYDGSECPSGHVILRENINKFNKNNDYTILKGFSYEKEIINKVSDLIDKIDILFIDGDHSYKAIISDFENYFPKVREGGFIIFDDYLPYTRESHNSINYLVSKYKADLNVIGCLEDRINCNKIKPSQYIIDRKSPFPDIKNKKLYNMEFIIQKIR